MKNLLFIISFGICGIVQAQNTWLQKTNFGGAGRESAVGFSIGSKGYIGTGRDTNGIFLNDFWEYDPVTDSWTQKADMGGSLRQCAVGFSIGAKGYIGTGYTITGYLNDFWNMIP
jgi:N-acetylneuraminic acid mutarotase